MQAQKVKKNKKNPEMIGGYLDRMAEEMGWLPLKERFETDYVRSNGLRLKMSILRTDSNAPTVVFVPGTALYALCYAELLDGIAKQGYNVIGFDPRGHGLSEGERGDYTFEDIVHDTQAVITYAIQNFNEDICVMGARQGGVVALYATAADDRIGSAVCYNLADLSDVKQLNIFPAYTKILKPFMFGLSRIFPNMSVAIKRHMNVPKEQLRYFGDTLSFMEKDPLVLKRIKVKTLRSLKNAKLSRSIDEITTPVFVLQPEIDHVFPLDYTKKIVDRLGGKKRLEILKAKLLQ